MIENIVEYLKNLTPRDIKPGVITSLPFPDSYSVLEILHAIGEKLDYIINEGGGGGGGTSDLLWKPTVSSVGDISWARSSSTTPPASQNIKGPQGVAGPKGSDGATGPAGPAGPQGATGPQGPKGADGAVGPQGPEGPAGPQGDTGAVGPQGPKGSDGATGPQGPAGPAGPQGATGATPTFEIGTVTKLDPDAEPTVTLEDVGGDLYMMDFGIPQGQPGTPGGGGGGGDVTAAGNNVFTGTNHFNGLTVLAETHVETPNDDNDATNKLYVDTLVSNTKKTTVEEVNQHTDEVVQALRVLPAGGTSGQVPTIADDGTSVEWKTPETGGGSGGGGVEWVAVALENPTPAIVKSTLNLYYDKADNTHLKLVGIFGTISSGTYKEIKLKLPYPNPLNYGENVFAALPTVPANVFRSIEAENLNSMLKIDDRDFFLQRSHVYRQGTEYIVGCEFYVVKNVTVSSPGLPDPTTPTTPTIPDPTDVPLPDPTVGE